MEQQFAELLSWNKDFRKSIKDAVKELLSRNKLPESIPSNRVAVFLEFSIETASIIWRNIHDQPTNTSEYSERAWAADFIADVILTGSISISDELGLDAKTTLYCTRNGHTASAPCCDKEESIRPLVTRLCGLSSDTDYRNCVAALANALNQYFSEVACVYESGQSQEPIIAKCPPVVARLWALLASCLDVYKHLVSGPPIKTGE